MSTLGPRLATAYVLALTLAGSGFAAGGEPVKVNVDNYARAETDEQLDRLLKQTGGVNRWYHFRGPVAIDKQSVIRMNRDTLYSANVADISAGATLSMPETNGRYQTVMIVSQDHYIWVFDKPGTYELSAQKYGSPYVLVAARTLVNADDPEDVRRVNALQDRLKLEAKSAKAFTHPRYDAASLKATADALKELQKGIAGFDRTFGTKEQVTETRHLIGVATGWGGLPSDQAYYVNRKPGKPVALYKLEVPKGVPMDGFWSVCIYNKEGYFEQNKLNAYTVNSTMAKPNADGSYTIYFGGLEQHKQQPNYLYIMPGWEYQVRLYKARKEVIEGSWTFPDIEPVR